MIQTPPAGETTSVVQLQAGERACFIGTPGKGKTTLTQWLAEELGSVCVLDSKLDPKEWQAWGPRHGYTVSRDPRDISRHRRLVFQVNQLALDDRKGWDKPGRPGYEWTDALRRLLARGHTTVIFDEALQSLPAGASHPEARRLFTQGRSFHLTVWAGTQLANRAETLIFRLSEHCFAFQTTNGDDLKLLEKARGLDCQVLTGLEPYQFAYHRVSAPEWRICSPVEA